MKIINFRGDLTDNSAKKEALPTKPSFGVSVPVQAFYWHSACLRNWLLFPDIGQDTVSDDDDAVVYNRD